MAGENNILTHKIIAQEGAAMLMEESKFIKSINREREREFNRDARGYKAGESVTVKIPPRPVVTEGAIFNEDDADINAREQSVELKIDYEKHVPLIFGAREQTLSLSKFKERYLRPAIRVLATDVDANFLRRAIVATNNHVIQSANEAHPLAAFGRARSLMNKNLAPDVRRFALLSSDFTNSIVDPSGTLFNPTAEIAKQYKEGYIGKARGFEFMESEHIFRFQNGSKVTGITVSGADQTGSTLNIAGLTNGDTIKAGQTFTITGVNLIHPVTHQSYGINSQHVVTEDFTAGGATGQIKIYPEITPKLVSAVRQANPTVDASPANAAALTFIGTANQFIDQAVCYDRDAYTCAFAPKKVLAGCDGYTFNTDTLAMRVMTFGEGRSDQEGTRIDLLGGFAAIRGNNASRVGRLVA